MADRRKIGIMGGTFDPPHIGHLISAEFAAEELGLEKVVFLPTGSITYKDSSGTPPDVRFEMTRLAVCGNPVFDICDIETKSRLCSYTCNTLEKLHDMYENAQLFFIVGADSLDYMDSWRNPEKIFSLAAVAAVRRRGYSDERCRLKIRELEKRFGADIRMLNMPVIEVSSTEIRERLRTGESARYMVTDNVLQYIKENGIY